MNLYDKIKSPFGDEETIKKIIKNFSEKNPHSSAEFYHHILRDDKETIDNNLYMNYFAENIYWPLLENDWEKIQDDVSKNGALKKVYDRFSSYQELANYIEQLDATTKDALKKYRDYSRKKIPDVENANKYKNILQEITNNAEELITAYNLDSDLYYSHVFHHSQDLMGFHFDSKVHDRTAIKEKAEIKFYINAGEDSFKVARLFLDKCRKSDVESYYFKVVDPMYKEQERNDRLCIYSTIEHSKKILEFLTQIQSENPDINFKNPPLTTGVIDDFIGIGTDTLDNDASYNQSISEVIYTTLVKVCGESSIKQSDLFNYIESNPDVLENIKGRIIQRSVERGCSKDKICVTDKLAKKLKTVEIADNTKRIEEKKSKETSSLVRKGNVQIADENGNIIIQDYINPDLMKDKVVLPNGNQINTKQYIEEVVAPYIPEGGTFKLKNGVEISARQFIEEYVMFEGQTKYKGDIEALINDTVDNGNFTMKSDNAASIEQVNAGEKADIVEQNEVIKENTPQIKGESLKASLRKAKVTESEVKDTQNKLKEDKAIQEYKSLRFKSSLGSITPEEQAKMKELLNIQAVQIYENERIARSQANKRTGQNQDKGMGR